MVSVLNIASGKLYELNFEVCYKIFIVSFPFV